MVQTVNNQDQDKPQNCSLSLRKLLSLAALFKLLRALFTFKNFMPEVMDEGQMWAWIIAVFETSCDKDES